ncbi:Afadin and alpha-actinin-binding-domain-containing protein [Exophiala viscosa]|uniref:Afadin and alpha-actinin-binding-domain-containing protein n=1 Tax=Exophiala viscosa TaxID=2486360 RepID=UPI0021994D32|nr:Afadin and alpha-actinin-binding-domain-containing protein [Exophiala viscosa]
MDSHGLERASQYLNNLLLARGLLSNGKPIDFACPDRNGRGTDATMSRVINLVHDLVLRRDQDAEQRESLAMNIRKTRADETQRLLDLQRLQDRNAELAREAASVESQERTLKAAARRAECQAKELKEQMLKMKSTLDQVRAKCLSDVRKRDVELDKLKAHLTGLQRGKKDASGMRINIMGWESEAKPNERRNGQDVSSAEWSLEKETNDFLAALVEETSTENVSLRRIVIDTMEILRDLTGLEETVSGQAAKQDDEDGIGVPGQYRKSRLKAAHSPDNLASCRALAEQMTSILEHCQTILKDPSFVPIEEVQVRDEEIIQLRVGWEKMATRWKEAVTMMDNWRRKTIQDGENVSMPDIPDLELGKSVAMLPNGRPIFGTDEELPSILSEHSKLDHGDEEALHGEQQSKPSSNSVKAESPESVLNMPLEPTPKRRASAARRAGLSIGRPVRPLQPIDHNLTRSPKRITSLENLLLPGSDSGIGSLDTRLDIENDPGRHLGDPRRDNEHDKHASTIPEKLAAVEAEAMEAQQLATQDSKKRKYGTRSKTRKGSRRRSTLSPDELADLLGI